MAYKLTVEKLNQYLAELEKEYILFAPVLSKGRGAFTNTDSVKYQEIKRFDEIWTYP